MAKQKVKVSKVNKQPSKFKIGLVKFFRSLFSNQAAIDSSKTSSWWVALIFVIVSAVLPVIPLTVSAANVSGSSYLGTSTQGLDTKITLASEFFEENKLDFVVGEDKTLHFLADDVDITSDFSDKENFMDYKIYENRGHVTGQYEFQVFYINESEDEVKHLVTYLNGDKYQFMRHTTNLKTDDDFEEATYYRPSYMVLARHGLYIYIYQEDSLTLKAYTNFASDWKNVAKGTHLISEVLTVKDVEKGTSAYYSQVYTNWTKIIDKTYTTAKTKNVVFSSLIYLGVYFALIIFMGLMIFVLTRGKKNVFNYLKFMDCQKITAWAAVCPAILAMILGFLLTSYAVMFFIILIGLRMMWISMRQLRPY